MALVKAKKKNVRRDMMILFLTFTTHRCFHLLYHQRPAVTTILPRQCDSLLPPLKLPGTKVSRNNTPLPPKKKRLTKTHTNPLYTASTSYLIPRVKPPFHRGDAPLLIVMKQSNVDTRSPRRPDKHASVVAASGTGFRLRDVLYG